MTDCPQKQKCLEVLQLVLDDEATPEEKEYCKEHLDECWSCFQDYKLEKALRELIQTKLEKKPVPSDLVDTIKLKINES